MIGLIKRSHAPELTLNLTGFPFLSGTCSPLRGELLARDRGKQRQASPLQESSSPHTECGVCLSASLRVQQEEATSSE